MAGGGSKDPATLPYRPCVGVVLCNPDGLVFTAERIDMPGAWQMPQGGIDDGEAPRAAALRELEEEIGVGPNGVRFVAEHPLWLTYDLPEHLVGRVWKGRWRGQRQRWFLFEFTGSEDTIDLLTDDPEFSNWKWSTPDEVVDEIVSFKRDIYRTVLSYFGPFLGAVEAGNGLSSDRP